MKKIKNYKLEQSFLYGLRNCRKLEQYLGLKRKTLKDVERFVSYDEFQIKKRNGGERSIHAPAIAIKRIQKDLLRYLSRIDKPPWLISSLGKSYVDNSRYHKESSYVITVDIKDFYNNCRFSKVYKTLCDTFHMAPDIACLLAKVLTYKEKLPTGAPTSQLIAFWAYQDMFENINAIAMRCGCKFTLYVDDMTFSSTTPISSQLLSEVVAQLQKCGHSIQRKKVKYYSAKDCKLITGAVIDKYGNIRVPNKLRKRIINDFEQLQQDNFTLTKIQRKILLATLIGRLNTARYIEPGIFPEIYRYTQLQKKQ